MLSQGLYGVPSVAAMTLGPQGQQGQPISLSLHLQGWEEAGLYEGRLEVAQLGCYISRHPEVRVLRAIRVISSIAGP